MSTGEKLVATLSPLGIAVHPGTQIGNETEYFSYNYDLVPSDFADNKPTLWIALLQVHYFCPVELNSLKRRRETIKLLFGAGFAYPEVTDASESDTQHFVFETEYITNLEE